MRRSRMCQANARILSHGKAAFGSGEIPKSLALCLFLLYLSLGAFTDFFHNHPIGSRGTPAQSCVACNWIQTSRTNLTLIQALPGPMWVFSPLPLFPQIFPSQTFEKLPRPRSPPLSSPWS